MYNHTAEDSILTDEEINDIVARSGEVTWDDFYSLFEGHALV